MLGFKLRLAGLLNVYDGNHYSTLPLPETTEYFFQTSVCFLIIKSYTLIKIYKVKFKEASKKCFRFLFPSLLQK